MRNKARVVHNWHRVLTSYGLVFLLAAFTSSHAFKIETKDILNYLKTHPTIELANISLAKKHHAIPTYFGRLTKNGEYLDRAGDVYGSDIELPADEDGSKLVQNFFMHVAPSENVENGEKVRLTWKGVSEPTEKDWIGFYCPGNDANGHFLDYLVVSQISPTWQDGYGFIDVHVYNMRTECEFRYHKKAIVTTTVARSNTIRFADGPQAASQGRLMLTGDPTQMRVMWTSGFVDSVFVLYGTSKTELGNKAYGTSSTYKADDMCAPPATTTGFRDPGYMHDVLLENLLPGEKYFYKFGSQKAMSPIYNFTAAIPAGNYSPYSFIMYGDMGIFDAAKVMAKNVINDIEPNCIKFIFHNGDISYAEGQAYIWDQWQALIQPYSTLVPYMVGIGNHEQDHLIGGSKDPSGAPGEGFHPLWGNYLQDSGGECGVPMYKRFHMPDNGNKLWWYSYDYGMVHFIMMSTEHNFEPGSRQYQWLENDLRKVDRTKTPWVIIGGHRAMYESAMLLSDFIVSVHMQQAFEDLLYKYKVDIAFWAHYHSYERTCKVYKRKCVADGTVHIIAGTAGAGLDQETWFDEVWSKRRFAAHGYGRVHVANMTSLHFEWINNSNLEVMDSFWLIK